LAETYGIYDYRRVPVDLLGTLVAGLREDSRISQKTNRVRASVDTILLAEILDRLNTLIWFFSEDGHKGKNRPKRSASAFFIDEDEKTPASMSIDAINNVLNININTENNGKEGD
jgi:hypothetical protein